MSPQPIDPAAIYAAYLALKRIVTRDDFSIWITEESGIAKIDTRTVTVLGSITVEIPETTLTFVRPPDVKPRARYKELYLRAAARCSSEALHALICTYNVASNAPVKPSTAQVSALLSAGKQEIVSTAYHGPTRPARGRIKADALGGHAQVTAGEPGRVPLVSRSSG